MALKRKRNHIVSDINFRLAAATERGVVVTYDTANAGYVQVQASVSGVVGTKAAGLLMNDVVDKDLNARPVNFQLFEVPLSGYVKLAKRGELGTDQVATGAVFGPGSGVYLADAGQVTNVQDSTQNESVGTALSTWPVLNASGVNTAEFVDVYWNIN